MSTGTDCEELHSLKIGEKVQVAAKGNICLEPVITFIHREQEKLQEFLSITTTKNNNLKITEDHLLFVEKIGLSQAIPARDVQIGDSVRETEWPHEDCYSPRHQHRV